MKKIITALMLAVMIMVFSGCRETPEKQYTDTMLEHMEYYDATGGIEKIWYYNYNLSGNPTKAVRYNTNNEPTQRDVYEYSDDASTVRKITFNQKGECARKVAYEYDGDKLISESTFGADEKQEVARVYEYNGDKLEATRTKKTENGNVTETTMKCVYEGDNLIAEIKYNSSDSKIGEVDYEYENGLLISKSYSGSEVGDCTEELPEYDADNKEIKRTYKSGDKIIYTDENKLDENGNITVKTRRDSFGTIIYERKYFYDTLVNLIG